MLPFDPLRGKRGAFRLALNLSELSDRAWALLVLSQTLGFATPHFQTIVRPSGVVEVWAVILQQRHRYDADPAVVVDPWDEPIAQLRAAMAESHPFDLLLLCNPEAYLEPLAAA